MLKRAQTKRAFTHQVKVRLYGLTFIGVVASLLALSIAVFNKAFTPVVWVTLETDTTGNQLDPAADVKMRGVNVGEVRAVESNGEMASVKLAIKPEYVELIPANVHARLIPKTLFGERYVNLIVPDKPSTQVIAAGNVISQDRTKAGVETQKVLDELLPVLQAVRPADLNMTLSAVANALEGRGDRLGQNLERVDAYLKKFNPQLPTLSADIAKLVEVSNTYADAAPDLLRSLRNTVVTARTVTEKRDQLASFITGTTRLAGTAEKVFADNGDRLIRLAAVNRPTLQLLARYAPEYPCLLQSLNEMEEKLASTFVDNRLHVTIEASLPMPAYEPGRDEPEFGERSGPNCRGLPNPDTSLPGRGTKLRDGTESGSGLAGTSAERSVVNALLAPTLGVPHDEVPPIATLLFAPMIRGTVVSNA